MPLYEYECRSCRARVEILQSFSDPPYSHCPKCGGEMKKLASAPSIQFKGSGFYKTDYPSNTSKPAATSESGSGSGETASGSGQTASGSGSAPAGSSAAASSSDSKATESK